MNKTPVYSPPRSLFVVIGIIIVVGGVLRLLATAPTWIHYDENYYLNLGVNFIENGELTYRMWRMPADTNIIAGSSSGYGVLVLTVWQQIFGVSLV
ncbi:MAG: hypothetical protein AAFV33_24450, partial [Chloroflexota bacterium]